MLGSLICSMASSNFTEDGKYSDLAKLVCSAEYTRPAHNPLIFLSVLNSFMPVTAFLGNTLILIALHKETSLHPPSKLLLRTLATTDLCVGIIVEPLTVSLWMSMAREQWNDCHYLNVASSITLTGYVLCTVTLYTLTAISVDRVLALLLGLRYKQVVRLKRTYVTVTVFSALAVVGTATHFWNDLITLRYGYINVSLCLVISGFSYVKILFALRHYRIQTQNCVHQEQPNQIVPLNIARYRKTVSSALWVQLTLVVCYLPHGIVQALITQKGLSYPVLLARGFTATLVFLNSSLNPILYCWKIREVRQAVKNTFKQLDSSCG